MGYESKLIVGQLGLPTKGEKSSYFLRIANINLCKCGHEGPLSSLIAIATERDNTERNLKFPLVHWSEMFSVRQDKVLESLEDEKKLSGRVNPDILKEVVQIISETAESWETNITEDNYGSKLRAVPVKEVYDAMLKSNAQSILEDGHGYRRYEVALAMLKSLMEGFPYGEVEEDGYDRNLYCVLWGY